MKEPNWQRVNELYYAALDRPREERARFLTEACREEDLRREVQSLLRYEQLDFELLDHPDTQISLRKADLAIRPALKWGRLIGSYKILEPLGAGGMGQVYRAEDLKLGRNVAIKILPGVTSDNADLSGLSAREARVLAQMNHPNIGAIYGLEEIDGVRALILELVDGPTLADRIRQGPIPADEALAIARQIIQALEYAHEKGIIHRDLKPANIKLTADDHTKVLDFGLADWSRLTGDLEGNIEPGVIAGTPGYMSPEQARGKSVDRRADVWAFGAVLYEMLTGRPAFKGKTVSETLLRVISEEPDWRLLPRGTPPGVRRLLELCLRKDPKARLRDIGDAQIVLELASEQQVPSNRSAGWWPGAVVATILLAIGVAALPQFSRVPAESAVTRWHLQPPPGATLISHAISPDGRHLALTAQEASGRITLWIRPMSDLKAVEIPGTEGATFPFWSPDSLSVGFFSAEELKKVSASGGPVQIISQCHGGRGGSWAPNGTILFSRTNDGVYSVSSGGGEPKPLTRLDGSMKEAGHYWPWVLPDGKHFLYTSLGARPDVHGIWVASLTAPRDRHRLVADQSRSAYATGRLLFVRDKLLMAQTTDDAGSALRGDPMTVAEGVFASVGASSGAAGFSVSDNGVLVLGGVSSGARKSLLTWFDRTGRRLGTVGQPAECLRLMLSPDQTRVVVDRPGSNRALDLFVLDLRRGTDSRLTFDPAFDTGPVWSPDGKYIAFSSNRSGTYDLYRRLSNGAGEGELLLHTENNKYPTDWSRDGRYILYVDTDARTKEDIWVLDLQTGAASPYLKTEFTEGTARFSPDGRWIAYNSEESGKSQIYVQSFPAGSSKLQVSAEGGGRIAWRADGKELYYTSGDLKLMAVDVTTSPHFAAGLPRALFDVPSLTDPHVAYDVSTDGRSFLMPVLTESAGAEPATVVRNWVAGLR